MSSPQPDNPYIAHRTWLLRHARDAIIYSVKHRQAPGVSLDGLDAALCEKRATFITLEKGGKLRGCMGHLAATEPLVIDVAHNAVAAARQDPRFPPVAESEIPALDISISILTPTEEVNVPSEQELLAAIRPGIDGLILQEGRRRATFLPSVWDELPDPGDFVRHLKMKAGWAQGYWSPTIKVFRYQSIYLSDHE